MNEPVEAVRDSSDPLRILVVDESPERLVLMQRALSDAGYHNIATLRDTAALVDTVSSVRPNVILIEVESPRRDTLEQLRLIRDRQPTPVVMFSQDPEAQSIQAAVASGVCAYSVDGLQPGHVRPAIEIAMATFQSFRSLRGQLQKARNELSEHKRIDRAKHILIADRGMSEDEAHRALRKLAMDRKRKLIDVADDLIAMSKLFRS